MRTLRLALAFLTRLPHPTDDPAESAPSGSAGTSPDSTGAALAAASAWFPAAGAVVAIASIAGVTAGSYLVGPGVGPIAGLAVGWWMTRGFHLDGLSDCFDGLLCNGPPDRRLAVMRDPHAGGLGAASLAVWIVARVGVLLATADAGTTLFALWAAPILARAPLALELRSPPATPGRGLYATLHAGIAPRHGAYALLLATMLLAPVAVVAPARLAAAGILAGIGTVGWHHTWRRALGGLTGDVLGAGVELREMLVLCAFATPLLTP